MVRGRAYHRYRTRPIRAAEELVRLINFVRAEHLSEGRTPPTVEAITRKMALLLKKEEVYRVLIR